MNELLCKTKPFFRKNASTILTCIGGVGVIATAVMAAKATPKALQLIEKAEEEKGDKLTTWETIETAGLTYVPTVITGIATIGCIFGANMLNKRQQAALMSAYALLDNSYKEYKQKVGELYGEDAHKKVKEEIVKDDYANKDIEKSNPEKQLFYDDFSGRYFESTTADVLKAEYNINRKLQMWSGVYLNEFYEALDIPAVDYGNYLGWSNSEVYDMTWASWLEFCHNKVVMDDGLECTIISFSPDPTFGFEDY